MSTHWETDNPYVGPRTFTQDQRNLFFGREREARALLSRVVAERLVLFYAQSGAGKSSLLNARLIPWIKEQARYLVLPIGRVGGELPDGMDGVANVYVFSLLLSLDDSSQGPSDLLPRFAEMRLSDFLAGLRTPDGEHYYYDAAVAQRLHQQDLPPSTQDQPPHLLIIDQFEEIVTTHPTRWSDRRDFFVQLGDAMRADPQLWVLLTLREDYVAALDPYARLLPGDLRSRFYMQRMEVDAALEAVREPTRLGQRPFAPTVAEKLVDNLRQIRAPGEKQSHLGQYVEPVQLQVVCYQLWENLKQRPPGPITDTEPTSSVADAELTATAAAVQTQLARVEATQTVVAYQNAIVLDLPFSGNYLITQLFGENPEYYSEFTYDGVAMRGHNGLDFGLPVGTLVLPVDDGTVIAAVADNPVYGNYILLEHAWGESFYTQLNILMVQEGDSIEQSQVIGTSGNTGASTGPHLHLGIRILPYDRADGYGGFTDPLPFLQDALARFTTPTP